MTTSKRMKKQIRKTITQIEEIEVEAPHFYKHDFMLDNIDVVKYGKIDTDNTVSIIKEEDYIRGKLKLTMEINDDGIEKACGSYFDEKMKCDSEEFNDIYTEFFTRLRSAGFEQ